MATLTTVAVHCAHPDGVFHVCLHTPGQDERPDLLFLRPRTALFRRGREHDDIFGLHAFFAHQPMKDVLKRAARLLGIRGGQMLDRAPLWAATARLTSRHTGGGRQRGVDMLRIASVLIRVERIALHRDVAQPPIQAPVVVQEDIEDALLRVAQQIGQHDPPRVLEIVRLVHNDGVEQSVLKTGTGPLRTAFIGSWMSPSTKTALVFATRTALRTCPCCAPSL
jgi:hypothetical protein